MSVNTEIIRYFARWGLFEEKVGRQGKGDQNVCNEPNYSEKIVLGPYHCLLRRNSFFKTQNFQKTPLFDLIFVSGMLPNENEVK